MFSGIIAADSRVPVDPTIARLVGDEFAALCDAAAAAAAAEADDDCPRGGLGAVAAAEWRGVVAVATARIAERRRRNLRIRVERSDAARGKA